MCWVGGVGSLASGCPERSVISLQTSARTAANPRRAPGGPSDARQPGGGASEGLLRLGNPDDCTRSGAEPRRGRRARARFHTGPPEGGASTGHSELAKPHRAGPGPRRARSQVPAQTAQNAYVVAVRRPYALIHPCIPPSICPSVRPSDERLLSSDSGRSRLILDQPVLITTILGTSLRAGRERVQTLLTS